MHKISVILPVYNAEKYIGDTIRSVLQQTFTDFELIAIDDGSSDGSLKILNSFDDHRLKIYHQENRGLSAALNTAFRYSSGDLLARIDADDICLPERFQKQVVFLDNNPSIAVVGSAVKYIGENGEYIARSFPTINVRYIRKKLALGLGCLADPTVMMRSEAFKVAGGYNELIRCGQDAILWAKMVNLGYIVGNISTPLVKYRLRNGALSNFEPDSEYEEIRRKIFSDCIHLPDELAIAYNEKYFKLLSSCTKITQERVLSVLNTNQFKLYQYLIAIKLPEKSCEKIVYLIRNALDTFR